MSETPEALELLDRAAADPSADELMRRCPEGATDAELRALVEKFRAERASWRAKP